jgi:hypothetical protein
MALIQATQTALGGVVPVKASEAGSLITITQQMIWTARGYGYQAMATTGVAPLVVRPDTTAMATLFNNTTKNFVIERVFAHWLVPAAVTTACLWICVHSVGMTAPTNDITVRNSTSGQGTTPEGLFDNGATVVDNGWFPWFQDAYVLTVTTPGGVLQGDVAGRIILPPTAAISMQVVASTAGVNRFCGGFHWFSVPSNELYVRNL